MNSFTYQPAASSNDASLSSLTSVRSKRLSPEALKCRRKFLRFFPKGFRDATYVSWERQYKVETHERWEAELSRKEFGRLLRQRKFDEIAARAIRVEQTFALQHDFLVRENGAARRSQVQA